MTKRRVSQRLSTWKPLIKVSILVLGIALCLTVVYATPLRDYFSKESVSEWRRRLQGTGWKGLAVFLVAGSVLVSMGFLRTVYSAIGGAVYGFALGTLWAHIGTMCGTALCFWFSRHLGREWIQRKWGERFKRIERRMEEHGFTIVLLIRLCPVGNNFITNCLAGVSSIRMGSFTLASLIGLAPQTAIYALLGSGLAKASAHQTGTSVALLLINSILFGLYYRYSRLGSSVARDLSDDEEE
ncbi:TVP38/TMEM64 family protein [Candidatus Sumerlaeota bacterium]|nr:TVP38/TMEM64 family protein [Candidatus Sumerlaeota bacterium]